MNRSYRILAIGLIGTALGACGGGGSSGGSTGATTATTSAVDITTGNGGDVAGEVVGAGSYAIGTGALGATFATAAIVQGTTQRTSIVTFALDQLSEGGTLVAGMTPTALGVVETLACSSGGTITLDLTDTNNDLELSSGDSLTMTLNNCDQGGLVSNGSMSISNVTVSGTIGSASPWTFGATFTFGNLSFTDSGLTLSVSGDMTILEQSPDGVAIETTASGNSLAASANNESFELSNYNFSYAEAAAGGSFSYSQSGTISSDTLGGSVDFSTAIGAPLTGTDFLSNWPDSGGALVITGAANSTVTVTPQGGNLVLVEIDANGDGNVDSSDTLTWDTL